MTTLELINCLFAENKDFYSWIYDIKFNQKVIAIKTTKQTEIIKLIQIITESFTIECTNSFVIITKK